MKSINKSINTDLTVEKFWISVNVLLKKTHVVNKRLWGSKIWFSRRCTSGYICNLPTKCMPLDSIITNENVDKHVSDIINQFKLCIDDINDGESSIEIHLIELLPKVYSDKHAYQLACLQRDKSLITLYDVTPSNDTQTLCPNYTFTIQLNSNTLVLTAYEVDESTKSYIWLTTTLLPQINKWGADSFLLKNNTSLCTESLALVSKTKYYEKYNDLKLKYGKEMVKIWPECTDPSKFVYEDVAIAAYLLLLWEQDNNKNTSFVDLGCGNGLLVYILSQEGHRGVGLDVRKRNIWDMYPPNILLQEKTITPSDTSLFPEADWVIGNHSDELTPWIPVIAAKSSFKCNFFLLPCCAYNFDGSKYQRRISHNSQYMDYLQYIKQLCLDCGFQVDTDRLKIPSTKRICLVSRGRTYLEKDYELHNKRIAIIINLGATNEDVNNSFKAREAVERVRNCTQIDMKVANAIISSITKYLLNDCNAEDPQWSAGKIVNINELVQLIPKDQLFLLKSECGGLQTLLKNNHHIFEVQSGKVAIRYPKTVEDITNNTKRRKPDQAPIKIQVKPCWFFSNHPQGCPLEDTICSFLHVKC